ncbi:hypothetical protein HanRHA438_Chr12g0572751 [Helianthus annuus]|uniref:Uncharacterized protein n=1 Tax=Helianthus annuus TaxID=4232 RepID=A0A9K3MXP6_HELAN|nr:hypothetical protein HanXRQr2_Chr12g0561471 [Helianthus annuus]KAJ0868270.1 hypothetical protein HanRHA438_Chr12g0572751 [Helianthus annuus]
MAATSEAIFQVLCSAGPSISHTRLCPNKYKFLDSTNDGLDFRSKGSGIKIYRRKSCRL